MSASVFATCFVMPAWWVRAFAATSGGSKSSQSALNLSLQAGLSPALAPMELQALASMLGDLQRQILLNSASDLSLDPAVHLKHLPVQASPKVFCFDRMLQLLPALRILEPSATGGCSSHPLFAGESLQRQPGGGFKLNLKLAPLGAELITGLSCRHRDLMRYGAGETPAQGIGTAAGGPLILWRSLWSELGPFDQTLLLRLEQAMQWQFRWLDADGSFGIDLAELFQNIELPRHGIFAARSAFATRVLLLTRLGRKLSDHGWLVKQPVQRYLALGTQDSSALTLSWQATRDRLESGERAAYLQTGTNYFTAALEAAGSEAFSQILGQGLLPGERQKFAALWPHLFAAALATPAPALSHLGGALLLPVGLYAEWWLRQRPGHSRPLPVADLATALLRSLDSDPSTIAAAWPLFLQELSRASDLLASLAQPSAYCLAHPGHWAELKSAALPIALPSIAPLPVDPPRSGIGADLGLKRVAGSELGRLRTSDRDRYNELKRSFIDTLDENRRKIVMEMQIRSQPELFDDYLRHSLIKFMVDNPSAWRGISGSAAKV